MANGLSREQLQQLARLGADARLAELDAERRVLLQAFPGLAAQAARRSKSASAVPRPHAVATAVVTAAKREGRHRKKRSAEQRKAASVRMRKVWAERRKASEA